MVEHPVPERQQGSARTPVFAVGNPSLDGGEGGTCRVAAAPASPGGTLAVPQLTGLLSVSSLSIERLLLFCFHTHLWRFWSLPDGRVPVPVSPGFCPRVLPQPSPCVTFSASLCPRWSRICPSTPRLGRWVLSGERVNPWASPQRHPTWPTTSCSHALQTPLLLAQKVCGVPARTLLPRHPAETRTQTPQNQTDQPSCQEALRVEVTCCPVSLPLPHGPGCWAAGRSPRALMAPTCSCAQLTPI